MVTGSDRAHYLADTVDLGPSQRYKVIREAREPCQWLLHCFIDQHTTYNNVEEAGQEGRL